MGANVDATELRAAVEKAEQDAAREHQKREAERAREFVERFVHEKSVDWQHTEATIGWLRVPANRAQISSPADLLSILQTGSKGSAPGKVVYLLARQAEELLDLYEQGELAWSYQHAIACRVLDAWNLGTGDRRLQHSTPRGNTYGYHAHEHKVPKTYQDFVSGMPYGVEYRMRDRCK